MDVAEYLRKSRMEEGMDTEEVLAKHRQALSEYAASHDLHIIETYYEVRSGESLYARPEMLRLLENVEAGKFEAVLVMDLDRLSRGRMTDQGLILDAFKDSNTKIITPEKTYDLNDELDDEFAEMKTFMSRREYKIINKRLRRGLAQSIQNGCYVANAPYGYRKITVDRKPTLEIYEPEAEFVRMIYSMYVSGYGCIRIAAHISALGARPHRSDSFNRSSIGKILRNPVYIGKIVWNQKKHTKKGRHGATKNIITYQPRDKWLIVDGLHPAIIDTETYDKVQEMMEGHGHYCHFDGTISSPLAGLLRCSNCGKNIQRMGYGKKGMYYEMCNTKGCCASAKFEYVEAAILEMLRDKLRELSVPETQKRGLDTSLVEATLESAKRELTAANGQKTRLYELLETGTYDLPTFRERMEAVKEKISDLEQRIAEAQDTIAAAKGTRPHLQAQRIKEVLDAYDDADAPHKNALLKSIIDVIWYTKAKKSKPMDFKLQMKLKPF